MWNAYIKLWAFLDPYFAYLVLIIYLEEKHMAYALKKGNKETRKIEVRAEELGDLDEKVGALKFQAEFKKTPSKQWQVDIDNLSSEELIKDKLVNVAGIKNDDGTEASFSPELVDALVSEGFILNAMIQALLVVQGGGKQAEWYKQQKLKNL